MLSLPFPISAIDTVKILKPPIEQEKVMRKETLIFRALQVSTA